MVLKVHPRRWPVCMGFREVSFRGSMAWCGRLRGQPHSHQFRVEVMEDKRHSRLELQSSRNQEGRLRPSHRRGWEDNPTRGSLISESQSRLIGLLGQKPPGPNCLLYG